MKRRPGEKQHARYGARKCWEKLFRKWTKKCVLRNPRDEYDISDSSIQENHESIHEKMMTGLKSEYSLLGLFYSIWYGNSNLWRLLGKNPSGYAKYPRLWWIDYLRDRGQELWELGEFTIVDEGRSVSKSERNSYKIFNHMKPTKLTWEWIEICDIGLYVCMTWAFVGII